MNMITIYYTREFMTGTLKGIVLKEESFTTDATRAPKVIKRMDGKSRRKVYGGAYVIDTFEFFKAAK
jgi:hypothetical protein